MKTQKVLSPKNFPTQLPFMWTIIAYLLLDKFQPVRGYRLKYQLDNQEILNYAI